MKTKKVAYTTVCGFAVAVALPAHAEFFSPHSRWMTGDWGGVRTELLEKGYDFQFSYQSESAANLSGGYDHDHTARYTDQFNLGGAFDLEKILGWRKANLQLLITERSGRDITNDRLTDPRTGTIASSVQENYGRGQTWRLTTLAYQQKFFDDVLDIKVGRLPLGSDFDSTGCVFQNNSLCGGLVGHASTVWYNSPVSQWGGRIKVNFTPEVYGQVGVYEYNPSLLESNNGFKLNTSGREGTTYITELGWTPAVGEAGMPGKYMVGGYWNSATANDVLEDRNGNVAQASGNSPDRLDGRYGMYAYARQQITTVDGDVKRGLSVFAHWAQYDKRSSTLDWQAQVGAIYAGPFDARPQDAVAIGFSELHVNPALSKNQRLHNELNGLVDYDDRAFQPVQRAEYAAEIHYDFKLTPWLMIRPNIQYLANPGGVYEVDNATVVGLTVNTVF
ncbi:porin [Pseudomonas capeferrum]|uniref:carbohydrate porin n=1 Tax=Pseudomonas capeferrum TaxID=1495066 RepID=UPI0015E3E000|nr:carbohydrate porin [Pseudomonas capeferrum]MBA1204401.1 porin [Pseudomonas capeferrum]